MGGFGYDDLGCSAVRRRRVQRGHAIDVELQRVDFHAFRFTLPLRDDVPRQRIIWFAIPVVEGQGKRLARNGVRV